jgi:hypothetical protein
LDAVLRWGRWYLGGVQGITSSPAGTV